MDLVAAVLGDHVERRAGGTAVFRGEVRGLNFDLFQEVGADVVDQAAIGAAVQVDRRHPRSCCSVGAVAVDGLIGGRQAGEDAELVRIGDDRAGNEREQLGIGAPVERDIVHLFLSMTCETSAETVFRASAADATTSMV